MQNKLFTKEDIKNKVCSNDLVYEDISKDWKNGLFVGGGSIGAISYSRNNLEWIINKNDVFDSRVHDADQKTHREVLDYIKQHNEKDFKFMGQFEKITNRVDLYSVTPVILRFNFGSGDLGWSAPALPRVSQRLSLYEGKLYSGADAAFVHARVETFSPHNKNLLAIRVEGCSTLDWGHLIELYRPFHEEMDLPEWKYENDVISFTQKMPGGDSYAVALYIKNRELDASRVKYDMPPDFVYENQNSYVKMGKISSYSAKISQGGDADIFVSVCSSYEFDDPLCAAVDEVLNAAKTGYEEIETNHKQWWEDFWQKSAVDFGKYTEIEKNWYVSAYILGSSLGTAPMPPLTGLFYGPLNETTPGVTSSNYNSDQNTQIPVMPLHLTNHIDLMKPFVDTFVNSYDELREKTKFLFGDTGGDGIYIPLVSNQNGKELVSPTYRYTICGSAYTGLMICWMWKYGRNLEMMRDKAYFILCELIRFYTNNLMELGSDGLYHLDVSIPPEIFTFTKDDCTTLSMLKVCLKTAVEVGRLLGEDNDELNHWEEMLEKLPEPAQRPNGAWWGGPDIPYDHFFFGGHLLYPFFPSETYLSDEDKENAKKTLDFIDDYAYERAFMDYEGCFHMLHDWSWFLTTATRQRLGMAERARTELKAFLDNFVKPNGFFTHNSILVMESSEAEKNCIVQKELRKDFKTSIDQPFWQTSGRCATANADAKDLAAPVMEGNASFLFCATEMLIQSYDGIIRLFPSVEKNFTGGFKGLLANGGFEVSASMKKGKVVYIKVKSLAGGLMRMYNPAQKGDRIISLEMIKGEEKEISF